MEIINDYLNAGDKTTRKEAHEKAKNLYLHYYGEEYKNKNEIEACGPAPIPRGLSWVLESSESGSGKSFSDVPRTRLAFCALNQDGTRSNHRKYIQLSAKELGTVRNLLPPYQAFISSFELEIIESMFKSNKKPC